MDNKITVRPTEQFDSSAIRYHLHEDTSDSRILPKRQLNWFGKQVTKLESANSTIAKIAKAILVGILATTIVGIAVLYKWKKEINLNQEGKKAADAALNQLNTQVKIRNGFAAIIDKLEFEISYFNDLQSFDNRPIDAIKENQMRNSIAKGTDERNNPFLLVKMSDRIGVPILMKLFYDNKINGWATDPPFFLDTMTNDLDTKSLEAFINKGEELRQGIKLYDAQENIQKRLGIEGDIPIVNFYNRITEKIDYITKRDFPENQCIIKGWDSQMRPFIAFKVVDTNGEDSVITLFQKVTWHDSIWECSHKTQHNSSGIDGSEMKEDQLLALIKIIDGRDPLYKVDLNASP